MRAAAWWLVWFTRSRELGVLRGRGQYHRHVLNRRVSERSDEGQVACHLPKGTTLCHRYAALHTNSGADGLPPPGEAQPVLFEFWRYTLHTASHTPSIFPTATTVG